jgi:glycosyltransferase involved in cell wall biosynthesis
MDKLISIILPNYNYSHYLPRAIQSVLTQNYPNFELIIIEDGSTDNSLEIIQEFIEQDRRIQLIRHLKNQGIFYSVNEGLEASKGEFFHGLGADDFYLPGFLRTSLLHLAKYPEIGTSVCESCYYENNPEQIRFYPFMTKIERSRVVLPKQAASLLQKTFLKFSATNCITKTEFVKKYGGYAEKFNASCDWILHTKIALTHGVIYVPEPLVCWKKNLKGVSGSILRNRKGRKAMYAHVLEDLSNAPQDLFKNFRISGELGCVIKYAPMEFFKRPKFWPFFLNILRRYIRRQWKRRVTGLFKKSVSHCEVSPNVSA